MSLQASPGTWRRICADQRTARCPPRPPAERARGRGGCGPPANTGANGTPPRRRRDSRSSLYNGYQRSGGHPLVGKRLGRGGTAMQPRITVLTLGVDDLERALAFYRDGLGLRTAGIVGTEWDQGAVAFFEL